MRTAVAQTSIDHYRGMDLGHQQREVLRTIELLHEACRADIARNLKWEKSTVLGRVNELLAKRLIIVIDKRPSKSTGVLSEYLRAVDIPGGLF